MWRSTITHLWVGQGGEVGVLLAGPVGGQGGEGLGGELLQAGARGRVVGLHVGVADGAGVRVVAGLVHHLREKSD